MITIKLGKLVNWMKYSLNILGIRLSKFLFLWMKFKIRSFGILLQMKNFLKINTLLWTNNDKISHHPKAKLLNSICKLKLIPKIELFAWKLIRGKIPTKGNLRKYWDGYQWWLSLLSTSFGKCSSSFYGLFFCPGYLEYNCWRLSYSY